MTFESTARNPLRHLLRAYDRAIRACELEDAGGALRALTLLRASLDANSPDAGGFDSIFVWCQRAVLSGDFIEPSRRLATLRNAWQTAEKVRPTTGSRTQQRVLQMVPPGE